MLRSSTGSRLDNFGSSLNTTYESEGYKFKVQVIFFFIYIQAYFKLADDDMCLNELFRDSLLMTMGIQFLA